MKIMTLLGTRPELIRLSRIMPLLDELSEHLLVHTGQNDDPGLGQIFFEQMGLRPPDHCFVSRAETPMQQIAHILVQTEKLLIAERPDRLLILGDTNSGLAAFVAKRQGIPVYHMEAGNRCFDSRVPEEVNRRLIDHASDILLPYTERSRQHLLAEGIPAARIYVTGNPIFEVLNHYAPQIAASTVLQQLRLQPQGYFLLTLHRQENVDHPQRLCQLLQAFEQLVQEHQLPLVCSLHPRTRSQLEKQGLQWPAGCQVLAPLGLFDFVALEQQARCVLSDSGTVQEECALFQVPSVSLREVTERPETLEIGSNLLAGTSPDSILRAVQTVLKPRTAWKPPPEYLVPAVSQAVVRILLGHHPATGGII